MSVSAFVKNVQNTAFRYGLWTKGTKMLVAVSGGPDSVCLLDVLVNLRQKYGWELRVVHVNYGLRGEESDAEEALVRRLAKQYSVPCSVLRPRADKDQANLEEKLRNIRYAFFERLRKRYRLDVVAVAHTLDDQAETLLLRLMRGSGLLGLRAMRPKHGTVIRPFLFTDRSAILQYLQMKQLSFRLDSSNVEKRFTRNRVRHDLLPFLEHSFNPSIKKILAQTAALLADDYDALLACLDDRMSSFPLRQQKNGVTFSAAEFGKLKPSLQKFFLRSLLEKWSERGVADFHRMEEVLKALKSRKNKAQIVRFGQLKIIRKGDTVTMTLA